MSTRELIIGTAGIYAAYLTLSLVNERLFTHEYINNDSQLGDEFQKDKYKYPDLCICLSSLLCALFSFFRSKIQKDPINQIPLKQYAILGILYTINILAASYALLYISYPVRVVSDKCGYLTAVVVGVYLSRIKRNDIKLQSKKVLIAIIITAGAVLFAFARQQEASKAWELVYNPDTMWVGYFLMFISISGEAFFTDSQAFCKITYKPTINHLMFTVNFMTTLICLASIVIKGDLVPSLTFCKSHPSVIIDIVLIGVLQVLGQISIYFIVLNFKQHIFPLVSTTRKVFTVLLSIFFFNHKMNNYQWIALILVFGGMGYQLIDQLYSDLFGKRRKGRRADSNNSNKEEESLQNSKQPSEISKESPQIQSSANQQYASQPEVQQQKKEDRWYQRLKMQPEDYFIQADQQLPEQIQLTQPSDQTLKNVSPSPGLPSKNSRNIKKLQQNLASEPEIQIKAKKDD